MANVRASILQALAAQGQASFASMHPTMPIAPGKEFPYIRNPVSSKKFKTNQDFGQSIEPSGRYMSYAETNRVPEGWESGQNTFQNPLYLNFDDGKWKQQISGVMGQKGKALSKALRQAGHDGIVTFDKYGPSEIIDLA